MSVLVIDASVAAKWFFEEIHSQCARRIRGMRVAMHGPEILLLEMDSVLVKRVRRGEITSAQAKDIGGCMRRLPIRLHGLAPLSDLAYDLAVQERLSVYDSLYLALAVRLNTKTVTADRKLERALRSGPFAKHLLWVEDIP
jgi:predicted nucleic acid-binding protein